jgi:hypothetical protein
VRRKTHRGVDVASAVRAFRLRVTESERAEHRPVTGNRDYERGARRQSTMQVRDRLSFGVRRSSGLEFDGDVLAHDRPASSHDLRDRTAAIVASQVILARERTQESCTGRSRVRAGNAADDRCVWDVEE